MKKSIWLTGLASLALAACGNSTTESEASADEDVADLATETAGDADSETSGMEAAVAGPDTGTLAWAIAGDWRGENAARDGFRNPEGTLEFFGVDPSSTVIEISPGGGWYAEILAPWISANGGTYVAAHFDADSSSEFRRISRANFEERFLNNDVFGNIVMGEFTPESSDMGAPGSADFVLTFRNTHGWMRGGYAERAFTDFFEVLAPGGHLGVVQHRLPDTREQDPRAMSGYVQQAYVIALAEEAGFELVGSSEVNANPADTADHPNGVWTLQPVGNGWDEEGFDSAPYEAIGESDRMTLLFRKPETSPVPSDGG
ncbi:class I SAM-dependent methyltransferase [Hyphobacterium sp.]|uniref:class I SAM-dependent methyltransferase n=1 Tax=Hyphobacterium sp. TaxID=2004662 RepID=UPI003BA9EA97